jgi:hypothetical protein
MKNLYLLFITLLITPMLFGQFGSDRFYRHANKTINLSMQSATFDGDSVFVPYNHWLKAGDECFRPDVRSVLGSEIRVSPEGIYEFVLSDEESVIMDSNGESDATWIAWVSASGDSLVEATVTEVMEDDPFGEPETIRTISLQLMDDAMNPLSGEVNAYTFQFGSQSGLISFPALLNFPEFVLTPFLEDFQLELIIEENDQEFKGLTKFDVYDFQPGDQIHIEEGSNSFGETSINQYKHIVLSRFDYPDEGMPVDSIVYTIEVQRWTYSGPLGEADPQPADTSIIDMRIEPDSIFDLPAGTALVEEGTAGAFNWLSASEFALSKNRYYAGPIFSANSQAGENCFGEILDWGCNFAKEVFIENLGGPYYDCQSSITVRNYRKLLYYNTDAGEWGEPLSTRDLRVSSSQFSLYPNPTKSEFTIQSELSTAIQRIEVYDLQGRMIRSFSPSGNRYSVENLKSGMYRLLIRLEDDRFGSLPLMVN